MASQPLTIKMLSALAVVVSLSITACTQLTPTAELNLQRVPVDVGSSNAVPRQTGEGTLTVKERDSQTIADELTLVETQELPGMQVDAWLNDDVALVSVENKTLPQYDSYVNGMVYPRSIYTYNINTQDLELVLERPGTSLSVGDVAPGGDYITFWDYLVGDASLYVMDLKTGETTLLGVETHTYWTDHRTVVGHDFHGAGVFEYTMGEESPDTTSSPEDLLTLFDATADYFFYGDDQNQVKKYDRITKQSEVLDLENVRDLVVSPDQTQLAVSLVTESGADKLYVGDLTGQGLEYVGENNTTADWSPNMQMLVYANSVGSQHGLFIKDFLYGNTTQILVGGEYFGIKWGPDSTRLAVASVDRDGNSNGAIIATLSGPATE